MCFDITYIFIVIAFIITMSAQTYMTSTFNKYQSIDSKCGFDAYKVATMILNSSGIYNVKIGHVQGNFTDHYAPLKKELNLSESTYSSKSIAAIGVAAHECGHAIQDHNKMWLLNFQMSIVPIVNIVSKMSMPMIIIGILIGLMQLAEFGIIMFATVLFYQLITLPIEFNASFNAVHALKSNGIMDESEIYGVKKVLFAAALTYVAAASTTMLQLLRFIFIINNSRRRN